MSSPSSPLKRASSLVSSPFRSSSWRWPANDLHSRPKRPKFTIDPIDTSHPPSSFHDPSPSPSSSSIGHAPDFALQPTKRRWTLAMAITDEEITDEVLVQQFDRMTMKSDPEWYPHDEWDVWDADRRSPPSWCGNLLLQDPPELMSKIPYTPSLPSFPTSSPLPTSKPAARSATTPSATWHAARRALLTCRELVRTERHYLRSLQSLLARETVTAPPPLMLHYVEELSNVSQTLVQLMENDPSAWGVAAAFLAVEQALETAFMGWCAVVGAWFEGRDIPPKRKIAFVETEHWVPLKRSVSTWRISVPSMSSPVSPSAFLTRRRDKAREHPGGPPKRRPSVRDLAILPTQRITRYVLLYRDLLDHTPSTSPSRALVERAVDAACRIAQKCDRAQGNTAFLQ